MEILQDGCCAFSDKLDIPGEGTGPFVMGAGWLLEIIHLRSGSFGFVSDGVALRPRGKTFGIFYPPFSLVMPEVKDLKGSVTGIGRFGDLDSKFEKPGIFQTDFEGSPRSREDASVVLISAKNVRSIEVNSRPSILSAKAKRMIDENYAIYPSISRIAGKLHVSPEHLSRQFKRDYYLSPSKYLHQLRIAEATYKLRTGKEIIEVSGDVGYNDLSRFYKQFRNTHKTSPGNCRSG